MRKDTKQRLYRIFLFAALALMFWLFDLTWLAWIFGVLVIIPLVAGGIIWAFQKHPERGVTIVHENRGYGANQPTVDNTKAPHVFDIEFKHSKPEDNITFTTQLTEEQKKEFTEAMKRVNKRPDTTSSLKSFKK